ncbi:helix-turn-helix domain-containing protein [Haloferax sp. DFSO60]|uniref:helix-turn-helix domain-containing protein n=1 Tax=Haloferax sp. DFSO60 TaxID=3388652 RepID=UPI00397A33FD
MATIVEIQIPADAFDIGRVFADLPGIEVELDRVVPTVNAVVPFLWVRGVEPQNVVEATTVHDGIHRVRVVDEVEGHGTLYRIEWSDSVESAITELSQLPLTLMGGTGTDDSWTFTLRAENRTNVSQLFEWCSTRDIPVSLTKIYHASAVKSPDEKGLSNAQHEALVIAYQQGYFDEPRRATLEDIASSLGISRQALAGRLRRGTRTLITPLVANS